MAEGGEAVAAAAGGAAPPSAEAAAAAESLKEQGNALYKSGQYLKAVRLKHASRCHAL